MGAGGGEGGVGVDMKLYHKTFAADSILAHGFMDSEGCYMTDTVYRGVWLSDRPLDDNEGADVDTLLSLEIPDEVVGKYEWIEDGKTYREFLVPAETVNRYGPVRVEKDD